MKKILLLITLIFGSMLYANPAPFGLEINKTTLNEAKGKYTLIKNGINKYSDGPIYLIKKDELKLDGLKEVKLIFSKDGKLLIAVIATFNQFKFKSLHQNLSEKYNLINENIEFVGDQNATYDDDQTLIELRSSHMSFDLSLTYISKEFDKKIEEMRKQEKEQKNKEELDSL